ncbi:MAG TPA: T9SS type A sorting domain-containing protein [Bacteroidia bacterium]|nr:T9SS type A sorting domain-containing protein [Bacteroidia bacterium]
MKITLLLLLSMMSAQIGISQCGADAGADIFSCASDTDAYSFPIGGNPTAQSGAAPFIYEWSIDPIVWIPNTIFVFYASDILDDTTAANPNVIDRGVATVIPFFLKVTDNNGCISYDTCIVSFSNFMHTLQGCFYWQINHGDSVFLNHGQNVFGGIGPLTYLWQPSHGLSDTTLPDGFWSKPDTSISYFVTVTDSVGCKEVGAPLYCIDVAPTGIAGNAEHESIIVYPNPANDQITLSIDPAISKSIERIEFFTIDGRLVFLMHYRFMDSIDVSGLPAGLYLGRIVNPTASYNFKFIKQ